MQTRAVTAAGYWSRAQLFHVSWRVLKSLGEKRGRPPTTVAEMYSITGIFIMLVDFDLIDLKVYTVTQQKRKSTCSLFRASRRVSSRSCVKNSGQKSKKTRPRIAKLPYLVFFGRSSL